MKSPITIILPLSLLMLAGCASSPPPPPVHYVPYYAHPVHPRHKPRYKKRRRPHPGEETRRRQRKPEAAARTVPEHAAAAEKKARPQRPVVLYANDASLAQQVNAALNTDPALHGTHIQVRAYQGTIGLAGQVANEAQKDRAVAVAGNVTGVKMVSDQLTTAH